jgi:geranylgeranyl reductase family protein
VDADVIIIGAGPAGSSAARLCAAAGLDTLIIDRATFPREKPCAGVLSPRAASLLGLADPNAARSGLRAHFHIAPTQPRPIRGLRRRPSWGGYRRISIQAERPLVYVVDRRVLDARRLGRARAAGARDVTAREVVTWGQDQEKVWVIVRDLAPVGDLHSGLGRTLTARFLVGADGAESVVARGLRARRQTLGPFLQTESVIFPLEPERAASVTGGGVDLHFGIIAGGYGWVIPGPAGLAVGVGAFIRDGGRAGNPDEVRARADKLTEALERLCAVYGELLPPLVPVGDPLRREWSIPLGGQRRRWAKGRVLLVGDAAGVADPLTGAGLGPAIASGEIAAGVIIARARQEGLGFGWRKTAAAGRPGEGPLGGERFGESLAAALGFAGRAQVSFRAHERSLWREITGAQRFRLLAARAASSLSCAGQGILFRRATLSWLAGAPDATRRSRGLSRPDRGSGS